MAVIGQSGREHVIDGFADGGEFAGRVGELCAGTATEAVIWQLTDQVGSVRMVMNESGAVQDRHDTAPFGDEINWGAVRATNAAQAGQTSAEASAATTSTGLYGWNETMRARYGGLERDTPTGLEHTQWRKYDGWQGRWTTTDPSLGSMSVGDPQSLNRYSYVQNDPVNGVDPRGLDANAAFDVIGYLDDPFDDPFFRRGGGGGGSGHIQPVRTLDPPADPVTPDPNFGLGDPPPPPQTEPERHMLNDCHAFAAIVAELARKSRTDTGFVAALRSRFEAPDAHEGGPRYREFTSTGFKDQFTDNVGPGNSPNQVHHYVGTFSRAYGAGVAGLAAGVLTGGSVDFVDTLSTALRVANNHEAGGLPTNAADTRLNGYSVPAGVMLGYGIIGRGDVANMIRKDICK